jgi:putative Mg2+ transporter-C (MgtC) family protein
VLAVWHGEHYLLQNSMMEGVQMTVPDILLRLLAAGFIGGLIGFERRSHHKAIGIAGMTMIAIGSATFMLLAKELSHSDPASISRTLQGASLWYRFFGRCCDLQEWP